MESVFDEWDVLDGMGGKNMRMGGGKGKEWFVGMVRKNEGCVESLDCCLVEKNEMYVGCIYSDGGEEVKRKREVKCWYVLVGGGDVIKFGVKGRGGGGVRVVGVGEEGYWVELEWEGVFMEKEGVGGLWL